jgi:hypothetical protein
MQYVPLNSLLKYKKMTRFIINISLHGAGDTDYEKLQVEMKKESFTCIKNHPEKGRGYLLRICEFTRRGSLTLKDITDAAFRAARKTGKEYSFTVIKDKFATNHLSASKNLTA